MTKIGTEELGVGGDIRQSDALVIQILNLSGMDIKRTMTNMFKKIKWQVKNFTRELESVFKRKKKGKNQIKIVNLKNTIARTDSLWHDGVKRLINPLPTKQL